MPKCRKRYIFSISFWEEEKPENRYLQQKSFLAQFLSPINDITLCYIPFDSEFNKQQNYIQHIGK